MQICNVTRRMLTFCCRWRRLVRWHLKGGSPHSIKKGEEGNPQSKIMTKSPRPKPARIPSFCVTSALGLLLCKQMGEGVAPLRSAWDPGETRAGARPPARTERPVKREKLRAMHTPVQVRKEKSSGRYVPKLQDCGARPSRTYTTAIPETQT